MQYLRTTILLPFLVLVSILVVDAAGADAIATVRRIRAANEASIIQEYAEFLKMPNVSRDREQIAELAKFIVNQFRARGVEATLLQLPGANPLVFGEIQAPNAQRTLLLYAHYDGQPYVREQWQTTSSPWDPALYSGPFELGGRKLPWPAPGTRIDGDWRIYARSAADDKAPIFAMWKVLEFLKASDFALTSNIKFLFDGEEEVGSPNLQEYLVRNQHLVDDAGIWVFCDGPLHQSRRPTVYFGVRGVVSVELTVFGAKRNLHSGHYGNWAPNPALRLSQLLASMKDEQGNVTVDGFYDSVAPVTPSVRAAIAEIPRIGDQLRAELGLSETENSNQRYEERMLLPSLNIRGLSSGAVGDRARNIIPRTATATIDVRLVKGNDPQRMLDLIETHIRKQGFQIVRERPDEETRRRHKRIVRVVRGTGYPAARTSMDDPMAQQLVRSLQMAAQGEPLVSIPTLGGSLPLYLVTDVLQKPLLLVPTANHDNNQHAPDENLRIANLWYALDAFTGILTME